MFKGKPKKRIIHYKPKPITRTRVKNNLIQYNQLKFVSIMQRKRSMRIRKLYNSLDNFQLELIIRHQIRVYEALGIGNTIKRV
jgi:adenine C2-methylase RlmN of 23S rRNA A2503 and tRNA A37